MAFESNESVEFKKYTGVNKPKIIGVNLGLDQLKEIGVNYKEEPKFSGEDKNGKPYISVVFWSKLEGFGQDLIVPIKFMIRPEQRKNNAGDKSQFIDKFGGTRWAESKESLESNEYFDAESAKPCYYGQEDMIKFLKAWLNVKKGGVAELDMDKILKGDFSELKSIVCNNKIGVLYTVSNGKYQNIWTGYFTRGFVDISDSKKQFKEALAKQADSGYPIKDDHSIEFKEYTSLTPDSDPSDNQEDGDPLPF